MRTSKKCDMTDTVGSSTTGQDPAVRFMNMVMSCQLSQKVGKFLRQLSNYQLLKEAVLHSFYAPLPSKERSVSKQQQEYNKIKQKATGSQSDLK